RGRHTQMVVRTAWHRLRLGETGGLEENAPRDSIVYFAGAFRWVGGGGWAGDCAPSGMVFGGRFPSVRTFLGITASDSVSPKHRTSANHRANTRAQRSNERGTCAHAPGPAVHAAR